MVLGRIAEQALEAADVLESLVDDRCPDDGVDEIRVGANAAEHARQQRHAVAEREQADVEHHVLEPVEKEDDADEKQQVVVAGHHVLGAEIHERRNRGPIDVLDKGRIPAAERMSADRRGAQQHADKETRAPAAEE